MQQLSHRHRPKAFYRNSAALQMDSLLDTMLTVDLNIGLSSTVVKVGPARDCMLMADRRSPYRRPECSWPAA